MMVTGLQIWTVYDHPKDYPDYFIAKKFDRDKPTQDYIADTSLTIIRDWLQRQGMTCIPRNDSDDPVIIETWF